MRVLFLSQIVPYPPHGGVLQRGFNLIRELATHAEIHLLAFVHPDVLPTSQAQYESRQALLQFCASVEYFELWPKKSPAHQLAALGTSFCSSTPFSAIAHRSRAFRQCVQDRLQRLAIDVIHVDTIALAQFVPDGNAIPAVLTHHNIESMLMERRGNVEKGAMARTFLLREAAKLRAYERDISPRFDVNIVMSPVDAAALKSIAPGVQSSVVPNGVDIEYFSPDRSAETSALIYTGGMNMFANKDAVLHFLSEVWPLIVRQRPDVRFVAVGQDPPPELRALSAQDQRIHVTGYVDDIRPLVRQASVYVVPLRVGGGTRLKVLDAMACGKALVSTSIGCEGLDVRNGEHLLVADSPAAFAQSTLELLETPSQRHALGDAARALVVQRYSWATVSEQLARAYRQARLERDRVA